MTSVHKSNTNVELIVSAIPAPVLVADYTPILERFAGMSAETVRGHLCDERTLEEALSLPRPVAASPEWIRLYGSPLSQSPPGLRDRNFSPELYPDLHETLVEQFTAPFRGVTSILREHKAPTLFGDVVVRSHWSASMNAGVPRWDNIVIVDLDVTDLRTAQRNLETMVDTKEQLVRSKDQLIAAVSHEIRTPLSAIVGFAELLLDSDDLSASERREMTEHLVQQGADLAGIVDDLLISAKTSLGQLELARVTVDLGAEAIRVIRSLPNSADHAISLPIATSRCLADPARLRQIIRNLLTNAIRYGGPEVSVTAHNGAARASLQVRDNGAGVPQEEVGSLFGAYQRNDEPSGSVPALGLGLHISRTLARRMGGDLTYRYEDDQSVFELTLPPAVAADTAPKPDASSVSRPATV